MQIRNEERRGQINNVLNELTLEKLEKYTIDACEKFKNIQTLTIRKKFQDKDSAINGFYACFCSEKRIPNAEGIAKINMLIKNIDEIQSVFLANLSNVNPKECLLQILNKSKEFEYFSLNQFIIKNIFTQSTHSQLKLSVPEENEVLESINDDLVQKINDKEKFDEKKLQLICIKLFDHITRKDTPPLKEIIQFGRT